MITGHLKRKQQTQEQSLNMNSELSGHVHKKPKIAQSNQFFISFHLVTCGLQGYDLGRDETAILQIGFQLINVISKQIIGQKLILLQASSLLDPSANHDKIHISIPAREMTELLTSLSSYSTKTLQEALDELDEFIKEISSKINEKSFEFIPVTIGHLPLRSVLHREARFRNITLKPYWYHYYDLCDQVSTFCDMPIQNTEDIYNALQITNTGTTTSNIIWTMTTAIMHLIHSGHVFHTRHIIKYNYKPILFHVDDEIEPDVVVMIKPIDYRTPISQIISFFRGVNIADGGVAVVMSEGRRSNKILIKFEDKLQRDIAILRDKHHMESGNSRFISISVVDSNEFMKIAGYQEENVKFYLQKIRDSEQVLVRIKGLPYTVTKNDILNFFVSQNVEIQFSYDGIFLVQKPSGELNGDAFIIFENELEAQKAKDLKGMTIGNRYMEIFYSTPPEMNQVIAAANKGIIKTKQGKSSIKNTKPVIPNILKIPQISDPVIGATITQHIPLEGTDLDFIKYLSDYQSLCLRFGRNNLSDSPGCISYIAIFKNSSDAEIVVKALCNKPFKIELSNREVAVETKEFPFLAKSVEQQTLLSRMFQKVAPSSFQLNSYLNLLPLSSKNFPTFANIPNTLNASSTNGSLLNYLSVPNMYTSNSQLNLIPQSNLLMYNQMPVLLGSGSCNKILAYQDLLSSSMQIDNLLSNYNQRFSLIPFAVSKTKKILLSGIMTEIKQQDLDNIFHSIASNISMLPKLIKNNQYFYAYFNCSEDVNIALQRCPIIFYSNQVIQLIPVHE